MCRPHRLGVRVGLAGEGGLVHPLGHEAELRPDELASVPAFRRERLTAAGAVGQIALARLAVEVRQAGVHRVNPAMTWLSHRWQREHVIIPS